MCMKEEKPRSVARNCSRDSSPVSVSSDETDESGHSNTREDRQVDLRSEIHTPGKTRRAVQRQSSSLKHASFHVTAGTLVSAVFVAFSLYFPFLLAPKAALKTYIFAFWEYDAEISHFDNTVLTYGTDYFLALSMLLIIVAIPCHKDSSFYQAGCRTRGLLASYMVSVAAGGLAHQFYTTVESQNTAHFRLLWTVCVGAVASASGFMGATATELVCLDRRDVDVVLPGIWKNKQLTIPVIPDWFWCAYAFCVTAIVVAGGFSFQRPACDIFVVGITQVPSTFYMMLILYAGLPKCDLSNIIRIAGCCGFILNAPLLPMYPILVQYTDLSLGRTNMLLHSVLLVAWSVQGLTLRHTGYAIMKTEELELEKKEV